uniref:Uncharacterized protein n=1 Tax=Arundo donax TaxID=35708 RepID=A0A0A9HIK5_ARUDO
MEHAFQICKSRIPTKCQQNNTSSTKHHGLYFFSMMHQAKRDRHLAFFMEIFIVATWNIWKQRNGWIFENKQSSFEAWKKGFHDEMLLQTHRFKQSLKADIISWLNCLA